MTDIQREQIFAISHVLREFGFRKESHCYFVKPKGEKATLLRMNFANFWHLQHYDWNGVNSYVPKMGNTWDAFGKEGVPVFAKFEKSGYICSVPNDEQILSFAKRHRFEIRNIKNLSDILFDLIMAFRDKSKDYKAFEKYMKLI